MHDTELIYKTTWKSDFWIWIIKFIPMGLFFYWGCLSIRDSIGLPLFSVSPIYRAWLQSPSGRGPLTFVISYLVLGLVTTIPIAFYFITSVYLLIYGKKRILVINKDGIRCPSTQWINKMVIPWTKISRITVNNKTINVTIFGLKNLISGKIWLARNYLNYYSVGNTLKIDLTDVMNTNFNKTDDEIKYDISKITNEYLNNDSSID